MTTADRICSFLESKLPRAFWEFHGPSIREFVLRELSAPCVPTCEQSMADYRDGKFSGIATAIQSLPPPVDFAQKSRVEPAAMQEVIGEDDKLTPFPSEFAKKVAAVREYCSDLKTNQLIPISGRIVMAVTPFGECRVRWCCDRDVWVDVKNGVVMSMPFKWRELTKDEEQVVV